MSGPATEPRGGGELARSRRDGRALVLAVHGASRAMKLYPVEHQAVQRALHDLAALTNEIREGDDELDLRIQGELAFVNGARLRLDLTNYASVGSLLALLRAAGIGAVRTTGPVGARDWLVLLSVLDAARAGQVAASPDAVGERLAQAGVTAFELGEPGDEVDAGDAETQAAAKRTYATSVSLTKDVINSVRMGRAPSLKKIKRAVQGIVDEVLHEETSILGLTTLREYDEYTYTHSVNVCIFAVALGKRLGMDKLQLYELGMGALLHDIGKSRVATHVLHKTDALDEQDWRQLTAHPWLGVLSLFQLRSQQELPYRAMLVAHEHHMKYDLTGYPRPLRPRMLGMTSRIVAVADGYDAATSRRSYQTVPYSPSDVLKEMRDNPRRGMDPVVVKAFINLLGIYPVGTLVVLDTFELAVVRAASVNPELVSRPTVVVVSDARGNLLDPPEVADLAARGPDGQFARTIIKTADPERYGIRVSDYLV